MYSRQLFSLSTFWNFWNFWNRYSIIFKKHFIAVISTFKATLLFVIILKHYQTGSKFVFLMQLQKKHCLAFIYSFINFNWNIFSPWIENLFLRSFNKNSYNETRNNTSKIIATFISRTTIMKRGNILFHKIQARNFQKTLKVLSQSPFAAIISAYKCTWSVS